MYVDLYKSCLIDSEKKQVMDILYKYKDTFSLKAEIGSSPNIEKEIDVTDKSPSSFIRPYHVKEGDKIFLIRNEKSALSRYIERRFFSLF